MEEKHVRKERFNACAARTQIRNTAFDWLHDNRIFLGCDCPSAHQRASKFVDCHHSYLGLTYHFLAAEHGQSTVRTPRVHTFYA